MKRIFSFFFFFYALSIVVFADWKQDLVTLNPDVIDSIVALDPEIDTFPNLKSYTIYYHQPLVHSDPSSVPFSLRAHLTVRTNQSIADAGMLVYVSGYEAEESAYKATNTLYTGENRSAQEMSVRYNLHQVSLEHRFFKYSTPPQPWTKAEGLKAVEAAADFHAIISALKKVFTGGRYIMSGVSKGGITTAMQGLFYPEDAHLFVPYMAPFCDSITDTRQAKYMQSHGWTEQLRKSMHDLQSEAITSEETQKYILDLFFKPDEPQDTTVFYDVVSQFELNFHAYYTRESVNEYIDRFNEISDSLVNLKRGTRASHLGYVFGFGESDTVPYFQRLDSMIVAFSVPETSHRKFMKRKLTVDPKAISDAYLYQAFTELGTYIMDPVFFFPDDQKAMARDIWSRHQPDSIYRTLTYSPSLRNKVMELMGTFPGKMVFLYGEDDHWTGPAMEDKYINNTNTYKYILPESNHVDCVNHLYDEKFKGSYSKLADEIWQLLDSVTPSSVEDMMASQTAPAYRKIMRNGKLVIIKDGKEYNIMGIEMK